MTTCSISNTFCKNPSEVLDYTVKWADWLDTDTISSFSFSVDDASLTIDSEGASGTDRIVFLSGGKLGKTYKVTCQIVTGTGRTGERSFFLKIVER